MISADKAQITKSRALLFPDVNLYALDFAIGNGWSRTLQWSNVEILNGFRSAFLQQHLVLHLLAMGLRAVIIYFNFKNNWLQHFLNNFHPRLIVYTVSMFDYGNILRTSFYTRVSLLRVLTSATRIQWLKTLEILNINRCHWYTEFAWQYQQRIWF